MDRSMANMIPVVFMVLLAISVGAKHVDLTSVKALNEPHNLEWLLSPDTKNLGEVSTESPPERSVCQTEECRDIAKRLIDSMNKSADPCEDFYEFACGNWEKHNPPTNENAEVWNLLVSLNVRAQEILNEMLAIPAKPDDVLPVKVMKKWFAACMDTDTIERRGVEPLLSTLARIGGWPVAMEPQMWDSDAYDWQKIDNYYARLLGLNALFELDVDENTENEKPIYKLKIAIPTLPDNTHILYNAVRNAETSDETNSIDKYDRNNIGDIGDYDDDECDDCDDNDSDEDDSDDASGDEDCDDCDDNDSDKDDSDDKSGDEDCEEDSDEDDSNDISDDDDDDCNDCDDKKSGNNDTPQNIIEGDSVSEDSDEPKVRLVKKKVSRKIHKNHDNEKQKNVEQVKTKRNKVARKHKAGTAEQKRRDKTAKKINHVKKQGNKMLEKRTKRNLLTTIVHHHIQHHEVKKHKDHPIKNRGFNSERKNELNSGEIETTTTVEQDGNENNNEDSNGSQEIPLLQQYYEIIATVIQSIVQITGAKIEPDDVQRQIKELVMFQLNLQRAATTQSPVNEENNTTLQTFQEWYDTLEHTSPVSKIDWIATVKNLLDEANVDVDPNDVIIVDKEYFVGLNNLLEKSSPRIIANYIHWSCISKMLLATTNELSTLYLQWLQVDPNYDPDAIWKREANESNPERVSYCIQQKKIKELVGYEYVKEYFSDGIKEFASDLFDDIQKESEYQIKASEWMDEDTRDVFLSKLVRMKKQVGFPDWYKNETLVRQHLRGLTVGSSHFENMLNYLRFEKWQVMRHLVTGNKYDVEQFYISPLTVNAVFFGQVNSITITAVDFQSPLFAFGRPNNVNFPLVGSVIGHEVNHGFDPAGFKLDKDGEEIDWDEDVLAEYNRRAACFAEQYDEYAQELLGAKKKGFGNLTLGENVADTMGLMAVYRAYKRRERECATVGPALPGLEEFSNDQIFFLSYGYTWCEWRKPKEEKDTDEHSPGRLRVIGPLSNLETFSNAFNCPANSKMNRKEKCNIWK